MQRGTYAWHLQKNPRHPTMCARIAHCRRKQVLRNLDRIPKHRVYIQQEGRRRQAPEHDKAQARVALELSAPPASSRHLNLCVTDSCRLARHSSSTDRGPSPTTKRPMRSMFGSVRLPMLCRFGLVPAPRFHSKLQVTLGQAYRS